MSLTAYLRKRLLDLLDEKRVLVWYDAEQAFGQVARTFAAPNNKVVLVGESRSLQSGFRSCPPLNRGQEEAATLRWQIGNVQMGSQAHR